MVGNKTMYNKLVRFCNATAPICYFLICANMIKIDYLYWTAATGKLSFLNGCKILNSTFLCRLLHTVRHSAREIRFKIGTIVTFDSAGEDRISLQPA